MEIDHAGSSKKNRSGILHIHQNWLVIAVFWYTGNTLVLRRIQSLSLLRTSDMQHTANYDTILNDILRANIANRFN